MGGLRIRVGAPPTQLSIAIARASLALRGRDVVVSPQQTFPLTISGRYFLTASGEPFPILADTAWEGMTRLSEANMDTYLDDLQTRKFTAVLVELITDGTFGGGPNTVDSIAPFSTVGDFSTLTTGYKDRIRYFLSGAKQRNILVIAAPLYNGFGDGSQGWLNEYQADTLAHRESYGNQIGSLCAEYGNVIFLLGGDGPNPADSTQATLRSSILASWSGALFTYHATRNTRGYPARGSLTLDFNNTYVDDGSVTHAFSEAASALSEFAGPFLLAEGYYEDDGTGVPTYLRRIAWQTICAGGAGHIYGHTDIWVFAANWQTQLADVGRAQMVHLQSLLTSYPINKLVPKTDATLVTTSLGSGASRICPALANDNTFALIYHQGTSAATVSMAAMSGVSSVRARWYDPTDGSYTNVSGQPFSPSGTQNLTFPGERCLVLDQA